MSTHKLVPCHPSHWTLAQMAKALSFHISIFSQGFSSKANLVTSEGFILKNITSDTHQDYFLHPKKNTEFLTDGNTEQQLPCTFPAIIVVQ